VICLAYCRIVLETDANNIAGKVATNAVDGAVPFSEQVCLFFQLLRLVIYHLIIYRGHILFSWSFHLQKKNKKKCIYVHDIVFFSNPVQTISQALATAREHLARSLLK
jgi:hypothetical protein